MTPHLAARGLMFLLGWHLVADAADVNIPAPAAALERQLATEPFRIVAAEISRPKARGDITRASMAATQRPRLLIMARQAATPNTTQTMAVNRAT